MRRTLVRFVMMVATLGLVLTGPLTDGMMVVPPHEARSAPSASSRADIAPAYKKRERKHRQKAAKRKKRSRSAANGNKCSGLTKMSLPGEDGCTHGPDPAPPGLDPQREVPLAAADSVSAEASAAAAVCDDDGQSGFRVQALYIHAADRTNRYTQTLPSIRGWVAAADQIFEANAAQTGGTRNLRVVHDASCTPVIDYVQVPTTGDDTFGNSISALRAQKYNRTDRIYLMFVDTTAAGICGIATMSSDDRPTDDNWNNDGPSYARIDAGCWTGSVAAHELMHNLGGVQDSAPHSTGAGHCIDEYDIMCYRDSSSSPPMQTVCADFALNSTRLDCNFDDFYNAHPAPGSYLATHWNVANSRFLIGGPDVDPPPPPAPAPTADPAPDAEPKAKAKAKHHRKHKKGKRKGNGGRSKHKRR